MAISPPLPPTAPSSQSRPAARATPRRPRVGVVKFASCDGCQLTLLDLEDALLAVTEAFDIVEFAEATSNRSSGPYDVLFVEGSISTPEQAEEIVRLREASALLVTIGACATAGGIQALRNMGDHEAFRAAVYPHPEYVESLATSSPVSDYVTVDAELRGCPIAPAQLLEVLTALATGRRPQLPNESVCAECKRRGLVCVAVANGTACLGPVTRTGCGALCPTFSRGCYGCFGPKESANAEGLASYYLRRGDRAEEVGRRFAGFTVNQEPFRSVVVAMDRLHGAHGKREENGR